MDKTTILVAMETRSRAFDFMLDAVRGLDNRGIKVKSINTDTLVVRTNNTQTCFIYDIREQPLDGVKADALFGVEPFKSAYKEYVKGSSKYDQGMGLVDYIYKIETWADIDEWSKMPPYLTQQQIYASLGRRNGKTALQNAFIEYYDYLKRTNTPISKQLEKYAEEYCRKDVEMASLLYKRFNMPKDKPTLPEIKNVIFNDPATIVMWADGTKTVVQCQDGDIYDPEKGLAMAISKKILGNKHDYYHTFKHWLKKYKKPEEVQEFEFTLKPGTFVSDSLFNGLTLGKGEFTFTFGDEKEDK